MGHLISLHSLLLLRTIQTKITKKIFIIYALHSKMESAQLSKDELAYWVNMCYSIIQCALEKVKLVIQLLISYLFSQPLYFSVSLSGK